MNYLELKEGILFKVRTSKLVRVLLYPYMNYKRVSNKKSMLRQRTRNIFGP